MQSALVLHGSDFISFVGLLNFWSISSQQPMVLHGGDDFSRFDLKTDGGFFG
jgi:hypothetical protein